VSDFTPGSKPREQAGSSRPTKVFLGIVAVVGIGLVAWAGLSTQHRRPVQAPGVVPSTIGASVNGTAIEAYRFGTGKKRYLIVGGMHGNEYGAAVGTALVARLTADQTLVPQGTEIDVIPLLNPDGNAASTRANAHGVDLNRNFPSKNWTPVLAHGDRTTLSGGTYGGSEPETKALLGCLKSNFHGIVSLHSKGGIVDYDGPDGLRIARSVSAETGLPVKHVAYQPSVHGSLGLYVPEKYHIPVITLELKSRTLSDGVLRGILAVANSD
jgi:murein peptide amidase A